MALDLLLDVDLVDGQALVDGVGIARSCRGRGGFEVERIRQAVGGIHAHHQRPVAQRESCRPVAAARLVFPTPPLPLNSRIRIAACFNSISGGLPDWVQKADKPHRSMFFEWNDSYKVEISSIDGQHRNLFGLVDELHRGMVAGTANTVMAEILDRLVRYTVTHFEHEERLMRDAGYPALGGHIAQHKALTSRVLQFQAEFQSGRVAMSVTLLKFLKDWLSQHIMESDQAYAPVVRKHHALV